jgi:hypothetical protein
MQLNPLQLRSYQVEYETSDISIEHLRMKYQIPEDYQLDTAGWEKRQAYLPAPQPPETAPQQVLTQPVATEEDGVTQMLSDITKFKRGVVDRALTFLETEAEYAEVKELKDMVAIVDSVEKSIKGQVPQGPTVNVFIQNLLQNFRDDV